MLLISLKPQAIPLNLKVLIIGNSEIYHSLLAVDDDFRKLFKIKVEFEDSSDRTEENMNKIAKFILRHIQRFYGALYLFCKGIGSRIK